MHCLETIRKINEQADQQAIELQANITFQPIRLLCYTAFGIALYILLPYVI